MTLSCVGNDPQSGSGGDPGPCPANDGACPGDELPCTTSADCAAGESCLDGACEAPEPAGCLFDTDCAAGEVCLDGACEAPACTTDADCAAGEACLAGGCEAQEDPVCFDEDATCLFDVECCSGVCGADNLCAAACLDAAGVCDEDVDCCSGTCVLPVDSSGPGTCAAEPECPGDPELPDGQK